MWTSKSTCTWARARARRGSSKGKTVGSQMWMTVQRRARASSKAERLRMPWWGMEYRVGVRDKGKVYESRNDRLDHGCDGVQGRLPQASGGVGW